MHLFTCYLWLCFPVHYYLLNLKHPVAPVC
jgi:hypothetical protein